VEHSLSSLSLSFSLSLPLSLFPSLSPSHVKEGFSLENLGKKTPSPLRLLGRQPKRLEASQGLILDCQCYMGGAETSVH
jgi:hypothetical protein